ncbi:hypothetical protein K0M31_017315, partial [Melipona bicolor]
MTNDPRKRGTRDTRREAAVSTAFHQVRLAGLLASRVARLRVWVARVRLWSGHSSHNNMAVAHIYPAPVFHVW